MDDQPFYAPGRKPEPKRLSPVPGERLFTIHRDGESLAVGLRYHAHGTELQVFIGREFLYGRLHKDKGAALAEASEMRADYRRDGWIDVTTSNE